MQHEGLNCMEKGYFVLSLENDTKCLSRVLDLVLDIFLMTAVFFIIGYVVMPITESDSMYTIMADAA